MDNDTNVSRAANTANAAESLPQRAPLSEHILQFFEFSHLPPHLQLVSKPFCQLAHAIVNGDNTAESGNTTFGPPLPRNPERTVALRKLLEAKDAAVRALVAKSPC
jgi:hypothetical protein